MTQATQALIVGRFVIVAENFAKASQGFFDSKAVHFTGPLDEIRKVFDRRHVYIAPFREAYGSKLKIAEAMAMGMAIVSTPKGVRGFGLRHGESVLISHNEEQFVQFVIDLLSDEKLRKRIGDGARQVALETIDWAVLGPRLRSMIGNVISANACR